jgi:thiamine biosynthesis protein ThiC
LKEFGFGRRGDERLGASRTGHLLRDACYVTPNKKDVKARVIGACARPPFAAHAADIAKSHRGAQYRR